MAVVVVVVVAVVVVVVGFAAAVAAAAVIAVVSTIPSFGVHGMLGPGESWLTLQLRPRSAPQLGDFGFLRTFSGSEIFKVRLLKVCSGFTPKLKLHYQAIRL